MGIGRVQVTCTHHNIFYKGLGCLQILVSVWGAESLEAIPQDAKPPV